MADTPKTRRERRQFTDELKAGVVRLALDNGKTVGAVARDRDLTETAVRDWVARARAERTYGKAGLTTAEREELARPRKENRVLQEGRDILKECRGLLREAESARFRFMAAEKASHTLTRLCRCLGGTRSGFYAWQRRPTSLHARRDAESRPHPRRVRRSRGRYGRPRICRDLHEDRERVSEKRVRRLMHREGLRARGA